MTSAQVRRAVVAGGLAVLGFAFAAFGPPFCPTALFFGLPCPGCGLTRATVAMLQGDFGAALQLHPLAPVLVPLFGGAVALALLDYVRGPELRRATPSWWTSRAATFAFSGLLAVLVGVWLARFAGYLGGPVPVESFRDLEARWLTPPAN
ncbi:MAG TPA: DUF2752 domain-containing protein [Candidatus Limnocylindrales bacterium]|nr:DUF2752 domain-containing protein [Candidatus Limnocylindrales bacterium]